MRNQSTPSAPPTGRSGGAPQLSFHHRAALNPRLRADDIDALMPVLKTGLKGDANATKRATRNAKGRLFVRPAHSTAPAKAFTPLVPADTNTIPSERPCEHIVGDYTDALQDVKTRRLEQLVSDNAIYYESSAEGSTSSQRSKRPTSAAIYRSIGEAWAQQKGEGITNATIATVNVTPRPKTASATKPSADTATNSAATVIPVPPKRPTTAPSRRPRSAKPTGGATSAADEPPAVPDTQDDGIPDDEDGLDEVHEAEVRESESNSSSRPTTAVQHRTIGGGHTTPRVPVGEDGEEMRSADAMTHGTASIIPVRLEPTRKKRFFTNFRYSSIRDYLQDRKQEEYGRHSMRVKAQLDFTRDIDVAISRAEAASPVGRGPATLPTVGEYVEMREKAAAAAARKHLEATNAAVAARVRQDRAIERLTRPTMKGAKAANRITAAVSRRPVAGTSGPVTANSPHRSTTVGRYRGMRSPQK